MATPKYTIHDFNSTIIERLQEALVEKIRDVPADDLEKVREYIREIKALEEDKPKADA